MHEEVTPIRTYAMVAAALVVLTFATIGASYLPIGRWHGLVALAFATLKALLVLMFFMNVRHSGPLMKIVIIVALFWFGVLVVGTMNDYLTRTWLQVAGH